MKSDLKIGSVSQSVSLQEDMFQCLKSVDVNRSWSQTVSGAKQKASKSPESSPVGFRNNRAQPASRQRLGKRYIEVHLSNEEARYLGAQSLELW